MRFLVISDSHGNYPSALQAETLAGDINAIIHLGDGISDAMLIAQTLDIEIMMVSGNCDLGSRAPRELILECEGKRLFLTHGDRYGVKSSMERLKKRGLEVGADIVLFGHTHIATIINLSEMLFINPGSLIQSSLQKTFAIVEINSGGVNASLQEIT